MIGKYNYSYTSSYYTVFTRYVMYLMMLYFYRIFEEKGGTSFLFSFRPTLHQNIQQKPMSIGPPVERIVCLKLPTPQIQIFLLHYLLMM